MRHPETRTRYANATRCTRSSPLFEPAVAEPIMKDGSNAAITHHQLEVMPVDRCPPPFVIQLPSILYPLHLVMAGTVEDLDRDAALCRHLTGARAIQGSKLIRGKGGSGMRDHGSTSTMWASGDSP